MRVSSGNIAVGFIGLVIGFFGVLYWHSGGVVIVTPATMTSATATAVVRTQAPKEVIDETYPLFSTGINWSSKVAVSLPPNSLYNPTNGTIVGYQVSSLPTAITNELSSVFEPFRVHYDQVLLKDGWKINTQYEADGPGGSLWGYTKGDNILILTYTSTFLNQVAGQPSQCPCTLVFTIIGGSLK